MEQCGCPWPHWQESLVSVCLTERERERRFIIICVQTHTHTHMLYSRASQGAEGNLCSSVGDKPLCPQEGSLWWPWVAAVQPWLWGPFHSAHPSHMHPEGGALSSSEKLWRRPATVVTFYHRTAQSPMQYSSIHSTYPRTEVVYCLWWETSPS